LLLLLPVGAELNGKLIALQDSRAQAVDARDVFGADEVRQLAGVMDRGLAGSVERLFLIFRRGPLGRRRHRQE
jgi:hypothetical protein